MQKRYQESPLTISAWAWGAGITIFAGLGIAIAPVNAHKVQIQEDVGATLHIEPNDIPLAGKPSEAWFALTQAGGTPIPLEACECKLTVYDSSNAAIATPPLSPTSAEGYTDIPGASVTFPDVGAYELVLAGEPSEGAQFAPFELRFEITVAGRAATAPSSEDTSEASSADLQSASGTKEPNNSAPTEVNAPPVSAETPGQAASSLTWRRLAPWGGAVLAVGVLWGVIGGLRSPGGKA